MIIFLQIIRVLTILLLISGGLGLVSGLFDFISGGPFENGILYIILTIVGIVGTGLITKKIRALKKLKDEEKQEK